MKTRLTTGFFVLLVLLTSIPALADLFKPGYFASHDGVGHVIRLQEFDIALRDGNIPVRLSKNLMWGYGYYFFNFNYPLPYILGEAGHFLGLGFVDATKLVFVLGLILSGMAMFAWQKNHWGNWGGLVAAIFYMYAPYRLVNLYVRGSVAEHLAFIMLPLLFMFTEKIVEGERRFDSLYVVFGGISFGLLVLAHNIMAFIFTIVLGLFMAFHLLLVRKWRVIVSFAAIGVLGIGLSAFFWFPSLSEKGYVRLDQTIARDYPHFFVSFWQLVKLSWGYGGSVDTTGNGLSVQVGLLHWGALLAGIAVAIILFRKRHQKAVHVIFYVGIFFLSVFLMVPASKFLWDRLPLLPFVQFPWRFLSWTVFSTSVLAGAFIYLVRNWAEPKNRLIVPLLTILIITLLLLADFRYWHPSEVVNVKLFGDRPIAGSTTWADEQFPIWFNPKPTTFPPSHVQIIGGLGNVSVSQWKTNQHDYQVTTTANSEVVENTAYYPGWNLTINGNPKLFNYQDKVYPGRIVYALAPGTYQINSQFSETPSRKVADIISLISAAVAAILLVLALWSRKTDTLINAAKNSGHKV